MPKGIKRRYQRLLVDLAIHSVANTKWQLSAKALRSDHPTLALTVNKSSNEQCSKVATLLLYSNHSARMISMGRYGHC